MKKIKICVKNENAIETAIENVETRCRSRLICFSDIVKAVKAIENALDLPKKYLKGCVYTIDVHAQKFPNAYKGIPESTQFTIERGSTDWFITNICRDKCDTVKYRAITIPDETIRYIGDRAITNAMYF